MKKKLCKKCGFEKPLKDMCKQSSGYGDGYQFLCKQHLKDYKKQYVIEHKEEIAAKKKQHYLEHKKEILSHNKKWREEHKEELRQHYIKNREINCAKSKGWYKDNKERAIKNHKQWKLKNKEHVVVYEKEYRAKNKKAISVRRKKYRIEHKEDIDKYDKQYRAAEQTKLLRKLTEHRREQRKRDLATDHDLTTEEWQHILESQDNKCLGCGKSFEIVKSTIDHIHPASKGGLLVKENVQALCDRCNPSKGAKTMEEFIASLK